MSRVYLIFRSTHETLKAEAVLQGAGLPCKVVSWTAGWRSAYTMRISPVP